MPPTHITVTAPEGRLTPIHPSDGADSSAPLLYVAPGTVCRVKYSQNTRRSIARGDLIPCDLDGKPTGDVVKREFDLDAAAAPKPFEHGSEKIDLAVAAKEKADAAAAAAKLEPPIAAPTFVTPAPDMQAKAATQTTDALRGPTPTFDTSEKE